VQLFLKCRKMQSQLGLRGIIESLSGGLYENCFKALTACVRISAIEPPALLMHDTTGTGISGRDRLPSQFMLMLFMMPLYPSDKGLLPIDGRAVAI
jgi:hypothetical protein